MIRYAKLTGRLEDGCVECEGLHGVTYLAKPVYAFPLFAVPSEKWLEQYSMLFLAVLDFEQEKMDRPLFIGVVPLDEKFVPNFSVDTPQLRSAKHTITLDDKMEVLGVETPKLVVVADKIQLGSTQAKEQAVLGNQLVSLLDEMLSSIQKLTVPTGFGPSGVPINGFEFARIAQQLKQILSNTTNLD